MTSRNRAQFHEIPAKPQVPNTPEATHNPKVAGSNPAPAIQGKPWKFRAFSFGQSREGPLPGRNRRNPGAFRDKIPGRVALRASTGLMIGGGRCRLGCASRHGGASIRSYGRLLTTSCKLVLDRVCGWSAVVPTAKCATYRRAREVLADVAGDRRERAARRTRRGLPAGRDHEDVPDRVEFRWRSGDDVTTRRR